MNIYIAISLIWIGLVVGFALSSLIMLHMFYDDRWSDGFGCGFIEGIKQYENNVAIMSKGEQDETD